MNQTYRMVEDQLKADIAEFNVEKNDHRILARAVRKLINLDNSKFEPDYLELISILSNEEGSFKLAIWGVRNLERLSRQRGMLDDSLCDQIKELHQLVSKALRLAE